MKHVCLSLNLRNLISSPTRITATTAKTLDVVLTNIEQYPITGGITEQVDFSDHAAVFCSLTRPETATRRPDNQESSVVVRSWPNGGQGNATTQMEEALARQMNTLTSSRINPMWNEWKTKFIAALDEVAPQCAVQKKKNGQALSLDDTGAFAPTAPTKITFQKKNAVWSGEPNIVNCGTIIIGKRLTM